MRNKRMIKKRRNNRRIEKRRSRMIRTFLKTKLRI